MRPYRYIFSIILLIFAVGWSLWYVFAGFGNPMDPCFWLNRYAALKGGWMTAGTVLTGGLIVKLSGAHLLPLRIFGWCCTVAAIALPYFALQDREGRRDNLHWLALAFGLMGYGAFQEFSPGTLSVLLLSLLWVTQSPIVLGLAVAVRFPNILALLVLLPLWKKKSLWKVPVAALTAGVIYLLGAFLLTPAPMDPAMSSHGIGDMIVKLWENGGKAASYALMWLGVVAIPLITNYRLPITKYQFPILGIIVGAMLFYYVSYATPVHQWYNIDLTYFISVGCLMLAVLTKRKELLFGAAICVVASLGTDTAWLKLFPVSLCLLPVAAGTYEPKMRTYLFPVLVGLTAVTMVRFCNNSIGNYDLSKATVVSSVAPYEGIRVQENDERRMSRYKLDFDSLTSENPVRVLALGEDMHRMRAVTGCEAARFNEFWSNIFDSVYTAKYREIIREEHPIVFCSFSPSFRTIPTYKNTQSAMENMLREEGYREIDRKKYKYMIYIPTTNDQTPTTDDPEIQ